MTSEHEKEKQRGKEHKECERERTTSINRLVPDLPWKWKTWFNWWKGMVREVYPIAIFLLNLFFYERGGEKEDRNEEIY